MLANQNRVEASFVSLDGNPADEILRYDAEFGADTIVLGSRGRGRVAGLLLGSVPQKVTALRAANDADRAVAEPDNALSSD